MKTYMELLKDGRWQMKKSDILKRDSFSCRICGAKASEGVTLNVHHLHYRKGAMPWEYDDDELVTLCENCHKREHDAIKQEIYNIKVGDFVIYDHSDFTNTGVIYDVDFENMTAKLASIDDGSDYETLWLETIHIKSDGSLVNGDGRKIERINGDRFFFDFVAECLYRIKNRKEQRFMIFQDDLNDSEEYGCIYKNLDSMLNNNQELREYFNKK